MSLAAGLDADRSRCTETGAKFCQTPGYGRCAGRHASYVDDKQQGNMEFQSHICRRRGFSGEPVVQAHGSFDNDEPGSIGKSGLVCSAEPLMRKILTCDIAGMFFPGLHPGIKIQGRTTAYGSMPAGIYEVRAGLEGANGKTSPCICGHQREGKRRFSATASGAADQDGRRAGSIGKAGHCTDLMFTVKR